MNRTQFENSIFKALDDVEEPDALLEWACEITGSIAGVLLRAETRGAPLTLVRTHPEDMTSTLTAGLDALKGWYEGEAPRGYERGWSLGKALELTKDTIFSDALVAFAPPLGNDAGACFELVLLRRGGDRFSSYDAWVAELLLKQHREGWVEQELRRALTERAEMARMRSALWGTALTANVIRTEPWEAFVERAEAGLKAERIKAEDRAAYLWVNALHWTAYRVRAGSGEVAAALVDLENKREPFGPAVDGLSGLARGALLFLLEDENLKALASSIREPKEKRKLKDLVKEAMAAKDVPEVFKDKHPYQQVAAIVLEHGLRLLRPKLEKGPLPAPDYRNGHDNPVSSLLDGAASLIRWFLSTAPQTGEKDAVEPTTRPLTRGAISREVLRYTFAVRIAEAEHLRARYCGGPRSAHAVEASGEARRLFVLSLVRYLAWLIDLIQDRLGLTPATAVSANEVLDAQIHLIDRYAHVQLGVDERLHVRELLKGSIEAEVQHYLGSRYRDHLLHSFDVFMIGDLLLNTKITWLGGRHKTLAAHLSEIPTPTPGTGRLFNGEEDVLRSWAIASLLHDIAYQFNWLRRLADDEKRGPAWIAFFKLPSPPLVTKLAPGEKDRADAFLATLVEVLPRLPVGVAWMPRAHEGEDLTRDHGVLSALRLAQLAAHLDSLEERPEGDRWPLSSSIAAPLHAIARHNLFDRRVKLSAEPLACLLRLCDELQEWDRKRVNTEKLLHALYLDILDQPGTSRDVLQHSECIHSAQANLQFKVPEGEDRLETTTTEASGDDKDKALIHFTLAYEDPKQGQYDATQTLLSKAYNLQHIDLSLDDHEGHHDLRLCLELRFPWPKEYGGRTEYDFYALLAEEAGALPLLPTFKGIHEVSGGGLIRLSTENQGGEDRFAIVVCRRAMDRHRYGWLPANPWPVIQDVEAFKKRVLAPSG